MVLWLTMLSTPHSFLKGTSCLTCQFHLLNLVTQKVDTRRSTPIKFLKMSKVFDGVLHSRLLTKSGNYGMLKVLLSGLSPCLCRSFQLININGCFPIPMVLSDGLFMVASLGAFHFYILMIYLGLFVVTQHSSLPMKLKWSTILKPAHLNSLLSLLLKA